MNTPEAYLETPTHVLYAGRCLRIEDLPAILHPSTPALCRDELGQVAPGHSIRRTDAVDLRIPARVVAREGALLMTLSDDAARAIAKAAVADPAWQGQRFTVDKALAAVLPDGRTIAQALDDGETARSRLNLVLDMVYTLLMDDSDGHDGATVARFPGATAGHMPTP